MTVDRRRSTGSIASATQALLDCQQPDGQWCFELEADATIPAEYVLLRHYLAEPVDAELERKIARLSAPHPGRSTAAGRCSMTATFDISASVKAYFALKMIGDSDRRAAHGAGARGDPRARRGGAGQRLHQADAGAVRLHPVARGAGDAGRDHAAAEMVSVPSRQDLVLEPHRHRAAAGADGAEARARNPKNVRIDELFLDPPATLGPAPKAPQQKRRAGSGSSASSTTCCARPSRCFRRARGSARSTRAVAWVARAAQRRGRARRDLSGDGEQRDDVRRARLSAGPSAAGDRAAARSRSSWSCIRTRPIASLASRRSGTPGLPAMRCWRPATPRRSGGWPRRCNGSSRSRSSTSRATGSRGGRTCAPAAGRSNMPTRIIPTSTTPRWW